jgi:hypothetical protein
MNQVAFVTHGKNMNLLLYVAQTEVMNQFAFVIHRRNMNQFYYVTQKLTVSYRTVVARIGDMNL